MWNVVSGCHKSIRCQLVKERSCFKYLSLLLRVLTRAPGERGQGRSPCLGNPFYILTAVRAWTALVGCAQSVLVICVKLYRTSHTYVQRI